MFCPSCGAERKGNQAYCKQCGQIMPDMKESIQRQSKQVTGMITLNALSIALGLISAVALYTTYFGGDSKSSIALAGAFCIAISAYQINNLIVALKLRRRMTAGPSLNRAQNTIAGDALANGQLLAAQPEAIAGRPSVTEDTTRQLSHRADEQ